MTTLSQIKMIRFLRSNGYYPKTIAKALELPIDNVHKVLKPSRKKKHKYRPIPNETVIKIREEYALMLDNGYKKMYIREELSRWHGVESSKIQSIVNRVTYKKI